VPTPSFTFVLPLSILLVVPSSPELLLLLLVPAGHLGVDEACKLHIVLVPHELLLGIGRWIEDVLLVWDGRGVLQVHLLHLLLHLVHHQVLVEAAHLLVLPLLGHHQVGIH